MSDSTYLVIQGRQGLADRVVALDRPTIRIGRSAECEVRLRDSPLAEVQVLIRRRGADWIAQPVGPSGRVWLGGRPLERQERWTPNLPLKVGSHQLSLRVERAANTPAGSFDHPIDLNVESSSEPTLIFPAADRPRSTALRAGAGISISKGSLFSSRGSASTAERTTMPTGWANRWRALGRIEHDAADRPEPTSTIKNEVPISRPPVAPPTPCPPSPFACGSTSVSGSGSRPRPTGPSFAASDLSASSVAPSVAVAPPTPTSIPSAKIAPTLSPTAIRPPHLKTLERPTATLDSPSRRPSHLHEPLNTVPVVDPPAPPVPPHPKAAVGGSPAASSPDRGRSVTLERTPPIPSPPPLPPTPPPIPVTRPATPPPHGKLQGNRVPAHPIWPSNPPISRTARIQPEPPPIASPPIPRPPIPTRSREKSRDQRDTNSIPIPPSTLNGNTTTAAASSTGSALADTINPPTQEEALPRRETLPADPTTALTNALPPLPDDPARPATTPPKTAIDSNPTQTHEPDFTTEPAVPAEPTRLLNAFARRWRDFATRSRVWSRPADAQTQTLATTTRPAAVPAEPPAISPPAVTPTNTAPVAPDLEEPISNPTAARTVEPFVDEQARRPSRRRVAPAPSRIPQRDSRPRTRNTAEPKPRPRIGTGAEAELPSAREILAACGLEHAPRRPRALIHDPSVSVSRVKMVAPIEPTPSDAPECWTPPLSGAVTWAGLVTTAVLGLGAVLLTTAQALVQRDARVIANALSRPDGPLFGPALLLEMEACQPPRGIWWLDRADSVYRHAAALVLARPGSPPLEQVEALLFQAGRIAPTHPGVRLAKVSRMNFPGSDSPTPMPIPDTLLDTLPIQPRDPSALTWVAQRLWRQGREREAARAFREALELVVRSDLTGREREDLPERDGPRFDEDPTVRRFELPGEGACRAIVSLLLDSHSPPDRSANANANASSSSNTRRDASASHWREAMPRHAVVWLAAGKELRERGDPQAAEVFEEAGRLGRDEPLSGSSKAVHHAAAAEALAMVRRFEEAETLYRLALKETTHDAIRRSWSYNLADIYSRLNQEDNRMRALAAARGRNLNETITRRAIEAERQTLPRGGLGMADPPFRGTPSR